MPIDRDRLQRLQALSDTQRTSPASSSTTLAPDRLARLQAMSDAQSSSIGGTLARSTARSTVPALSGVAGAGAAITAGAPLIAASGPFAPLTTVALGVAGGFGGGVIGSAAQEGIFQAVAPEARRRLNEQMAVDVREHPVASLVGQLAPQALTLRPSLRAPMSMKALGGTIGATTEAVGEVARGERLDPKRIAISGTAGAVLNRPTKLGQRLGLPPMSKTVPASKVGTKSEALKTQLVDRFAPVQHLVDDFEQLAGRPVKPAENAYQAARLYAGIPGRIEVRAKELGTILKPAANEMDDLSRVLIAERNAELSSQGRGLAQGAQIKLRSGKAVPVNDLATLQQQLGPDKFQRLQQVASQVTEYNNRVLLADLVDSGIISQASADAAKANNQKYVPFAALESLADDLLQEGGTRFGRQSFQVARQDAFKRLEGGAKLLDDPLVANMERVFKLTTLAERNRVGRKVLALGRTPAGQGLVRPLGKQQRPIKGFSEFTVFEQGKPTKVAIPTPVAEAMKGLTQQNIDFITKAASLGSRALRSGATTFSLGFAVTNPIRDFQLAKLVSRQIGVPFNVRSWMRGFWDALQVTPSSRTTFDDFERSLGSFGGFFRGGAGVGEARPAAQTLARVAPTTGRRVAQIANTVLNPTVWIRKVGETLEMAPRLAVYRQALQQGKSSADAAFAARNATIDFARMGQSMKLANMWVPFLNARLQGTLNTFGAVRGNPTGAAWVATSMIGAPLVATWVWNNNQFPQVWQDIPQYEKDNNFIVILGAQQDAQGRYTQVFKLPKGDVGRVFGNPLENVLAYLWQHDPKSLETVGLQMLSDVSPIPFERDGQFAPDRALGGITPPPLEAARILAEPQAKSRFTGFPVVPRRLQDVSPGLRTTPRTSESLKRFARTPIGKQLRVSPIQTETAIGTAFGTAGRDVLALIDRIAFGQRGRGPAVIGSASRRFVGVSGGAEEEKWIERALALGQESRDANEIKRQEADTLLQQLKQLAGDDHARAQLLEQARQRDPGVFTRLRDAAIAEQRGITQLDRIVVHLPVEARARFVHERLAALRSDQERQALLQDLTRKKILTPQVRAALRRVRPGVTPTAQAQEARR